MYDERLILIAVETEILIPFGNVFQLRHKADTFSSSLRCLNIES